MKKNWLEWTVFGLSAALLICTLGYLSLDAYRMQDRPPLLQIELGQTQWRKSGATTLYHVPVKVYNRGDRTAQGAGVEVTLKVPGQPEETAGFEVDYLPRRSRRDGEVTFTLDPRRGKLAAKIAGYSKP